ncbi:hypothetical protein VIGAN_08357900 [Vigna angularis var. angularis]|uniref:Uncharacterized protein n=1 Tax=Vigna angularis var. angularis TaxID=157739 RepID=A0A0S3SUR8_PHAAN|nr:hypothetical protein VIGAN_08357900 [Vigna angularis var. angularis]
MNESRWTVFIHDALKEKKREQTFSDFDISLTNPLPSCQLLPQAHRSLHGTLRAIVRRAHNPHLHRFLRLHLPPREHYVTSRRYLLPHDGCKVVRERDPEVHLRHVEDAAVAAHEDVVVRERENSSRRGSVTGDSGDGGDGKGEECGEDGAKGVRHSAEADAGSLRVGSCTRPAEVEPIAEESALGGGDEGGGGGCLGVDLGESGEEGGEECGVETVLFVAFTG